MKVPAAAAGSGGGVELRDLLVADDREIDAFRNPALSPGGQPAGERLIVAGMGEVDQQGQVVDSLGRKQHADDEAAQDLGIDRDLHLLAGLRLAHLDLDRLLGEAFQQRAEFLCEVRKGVVATRLPGAGGEGLVQRLLGGPGNLEPHRHVEGDHAMQDDGADAFRMLAQVDHRRLGSIRHAVEVEPRISEPAADLVQVVHREGSRVVAQVGLALQLLAATADRLQEAGLVPILRVRGIRGQLAFQRIGRPAPPLIDQQDVAAPPQVGKALLK